MFFESVFYVFFVGLAKLYCGATPPSVMVLLAQSGALYVKQSPGIANYCINATRATHATITIMTTTNIPIRPCQEPCPFEQHFSFRGVSLKHACI